MCVGRLARVWDAWWGDERHIRRGGIVLLFNRGKFYGFSNFCIFFLEFSEKNRKFAIRYQLSQYFAMGKYINPFTDWGFKRLFGQEFSKDLLISFLNDLLVDEMHIRDVTFKDKEQLADSKDLRGCIFDIYCETDDGNHFIVEMQNRWVPFFVNRSIYYASKAIVGQRKKTIEQKPALYQLMPVYVVCLMNFMPKDNAVSKFRTDVALYEKGSQDVFSDNLHFIYLSLPFFDKKAEECESDFDKWIYVLKHMEALERMPFTAQKKIFKRLAELADSRCLSQEEQEKYDESLKAADDYYGVLMSYYMNGIDEGVAKGEAKGFAKGEAKGFAKGEARGSYHKSLDIAKKMLLKGMDDDSIMELTGLTHEQLHQLKS
ncbi:Rpn family recombination-promoting nuclease/putative transposase [Prevotella copri]|uniref:Rpn family recombination-promoting nuclease/putative transposase n=9 Tax=Bacteroidales TaxID=171549 RepID=A0AAW5IKJ8_9BACT|nr:Rpn family recombination-promoting nuclease/putative transposase [Segatella copri]MCP9538345.1 Rpn family recombination-promoting nuclease/putative transposase [Segatella copri]MCP9541275.1 Rpn family recombination-promoting nuclease/putative transposase [Segatella copri]MCP9559636.1 Rpn family recombination-promoting nuclease/putative transposase [Segatella copri]MCP9562421.1 Rpn family recombination-promoting nuclease/putative transposase [Segatella copri]